jgi:hypothetical protein
MLTAVISGKIQEVKASFAQAMLDAALKPTRWELSATTLKLVVCRNTALGGEVNGQPQAAGTFLGRGKKEKRG